MQFISNLMTTLFCKEAGSDSYGNRYFIAKNGRRRVLYAGNAEASAVPPEWHGWLHYSAEGPASQPPYAWQRRHEPNKTGTDGAYFPPGTPQSGTGPAAPEPYSAWRPEE